MGVVFEIRDEIVVIDQPVTLRFSGSGQQVRFEIGHMPVEGPLRPARYPRGFFDSDFLSSPFRERRDFVRHSSLL